MTENHPCKMSLISDTFNEGEVAYELILNLNKFKISSYAVIIKVLFHYLAPTKYLLHKSTQNDIY